MQDIELVAIPRLAEQQVARAEIVLRLIDDSITFSFHLQAQQIYLLHVARLKRLRMSRITGTDDLQHKPASFTSL
ncbi:hypothetical protein PA598K_03040 [Paenibacillus sp. 598K]|nr:hypothetical protein PA598K_03040 [Paenibacillus sp. 598K]